MVNFLFVDLLDFDRRSGYLICKIVANKKRPALQVFCVIKDRLSNSDLGIGGGDVTVQIRHQETNQIVAVR